MITLSGRTAFITGGARGIGFGIASALAGRGVSVAIADVDQDALDHAQKELAQTTDVRAYRLDVRDRDAYAEIADAVEDALGPVTVVVNNAGVLDSISPAQMDHTMWDYVMGVNAGGVYNGIQAFVPRMIRRGDTGHVVNTSSVSGLYVGGPGLLYRSGFLYHASKFAVVGLSDSLRLELAHHGIGVSVLCPGPVATGIVENTRRRRPDNAPTHSSKITSILETAHEALNDEGLPPSVVGEMVTDAIVHDRPYILTESVSAGPIRDRADALLAAVPTLPFTPEEDR
ncbi:putative oxidoreductase, SDR-family [Nocardia nova SH22a]|uniref:Putative oxidoreductase, SDR-family n=1 Tax=Nocardia nova SH22a TaxID=1415166 RepID=W5TLJ9_9NOCA|nr:SDR family NAD(P)-dependent oxidoreductase [Nocardia nova]AHH19833.1 putative oxidoreductase, SDR-family [Nocardia nova SH22a]